MSAYRLKLYRVRVDHELRNEKRILESQIPLYVRGVDVGRFILEKGKARHATGWIELSNFMDRLGGWNQGNGNEHLIWHNFREDPAKLWVSKIDSKTFRLELKDWKMNLRGKGTPKPGDLLGVPATILHRDASIEMEKFNLVLVPINTSEWPTKNKPFSCYALHPKR